eukprot:5354187-Amphidinium_carterae.2
MGFQGLQLGEDDDSYVHLFFLLFADDVYLFSRDQTELTRMCELMAVELARIGLHFNAAKIQWGTTCPTTHLDSITLDGQRVSALQPGELMTVLGAGVSFHGNTDLELAVHMKRCWN